MTRWCAVAVATACVASLGCGSKVRPGLAVKFDAPPGDAKAARFSVTATFDHAMVTANTVGQVAREAPFVVRPALEGEYRWANDRTLVFVPKAPPARSTQYEVEIPKGTKALDGFGFEAPFRWSFETERIKAELSFAAKGLPDPEHWATPDVAVKVDTTQVALAKFVARACSFKAGDKKIGAVTSKEESDESPRKAFALTPESPLALDTNWVFRCDEMLVGVEGPLPLAAPVELPLHTYGAMRAVGIHPQGSDADVDDVEISVEFSNPPAKAARLPIRIEPKIDGFPANLAVDGAKLSLTARSLEPNTEYRIQVDGSLTDAFGQKIAGPFEASFVTGSSRPRLDIDTGSWAVEASRGAYPVWTRNLTRLEVQAAAVPVAKLPALLGALDFWDDEPINLAKLKIPAVKKKIPLKTRPNKWEQVALDPKQIVGGESATPGLYYFAVRAPEAEEGNRAREVLVNFTDLGLTTKFSAESGLVWATRLSDGKPAEGVEITILSRSGETKWSGATGPDGVVVAPGTATLLEETKKTRKGESEGDEDVQEERWHSASRLIVVARSATDVTFVDPMSGGGMSSWNFHVSSDSSHGKERVRGFVHSDRGLYRPGDTAHLRGLMRVLRAGEGLRVPSEPNVQIQVRDPRGHEIARHTKKLSRFGGFDLDVPIGEDAKLGDYSVHASISGGEVSERFSVEEYRPATIEVKASAAKPSYVAGQQVKAS
ncbi:MAG: MG2 domain-containing protein, partial [Polyangiaceae bacterium]